ncbi:MAG: LPS export ABC transporter ATP-binding protein [Deltaproteobacteria bacterium]|nr:LPS export ABC transporter ATP-binding protein [Deltaproteobacteria bacterium]
MSLLVDNIFKSYFSRRVVNGVSLHVSPGEVIGLLGPNGAGKTTTFYIIVGLVRHEGGRIFVDSQDVSTEPMYKRARLGISYLPQEASIFRKLTVEENIMAILETLEISADERRERLEALLRDLDTVHIRKSKGFSLSGGERRRVEITRALVTSPRYFLLDEPFAGIDPLAIEDIKVIIGKLKKKNIGVIISDHNVRDTLAVCDRAYIINEGTVLAEGTPEIITNNRLAREIYFGDCLAQEVAPLLKKG